ncbi:acyltransferase [Rahnella inusitata]|uniref:acyltransferase n=1 Tax=Rahnella inusitata TaxID=58169 RepID=UPI001BC866B1|nr:acyltransferase [Rahnella inusitata]QUT14119.1 acyltransferase [Rahnella inusitata]
MKKLTNLSSYSDENGNEIFFSGEISNGIDITFRGKNNKLYVSSDSKISELTISFDCDNAECRIGKTNGKFSLRIGQDSKVLIGDGVTTTARCFVCAVEGSTVDIGNDCMLAVGVSIRSDDSHPIFDISSGARINAAKSVVIGNHVWFGEGAAILSGTSIGDGCVVGMRAVVKGKFPNNCVIAGMPSKIIRKNIAWERPHLSLSAPFYKPDASSVEKSDYWKETEELNPELKITKLSMRNRIRMAASIIIRGKIA